MVKDIDNMDIAVYPDITKLNKFGLAIDRSFNDGIMQISVMEINDISIVGDDGYVLSTERSKVFVDVDEFYNLDDIEMDELRYAYYISHDSLVYVSDNYDELIEFVKNIINIKRLLG